MLVSAAGIGIAGSIGDLSTKRYDLQMDINVRGAFVVTREALPHLRAARGFVINIASIAGTMPTPGLSIYGASKAALIALTKSLNHEEAANGVRATAICPGFVDTPMSAWSGIPGEEMIQPEDCAEVVRMCLRLSPRARDTSKRVRRAPAARSWRTHTASRTPWTRNSPRSSRSK